MFLLLFDISERCHVMLIINIYYDILIKYFNFLNIFLKEKYNIIHYSRTRICQSPSLRSTRYDCLYYYFK